MPTRHFAETQVTDTGSDEPLHFVANRVKHAADLAIQTLLQDNAQPGRSDRLQSRESRAFPVEKNAVD